MNIFKYLINIGTGKQNEVISNKHIRFTNSVSLIICFFIVQNIILSIVYRQHHIASIQFIHFIFIAFVLFINYKGRRVLASAWFSGSAIFFVTIYSIIFTIESLNFTFLTMVILLQSFLFSPAEKIHIMFFTGITILCFLGVFFITSLDEQVIESLPSGLINAQRWNTVAGLPILSTLIGIYALFIINKAEEETAREKESLKIAQAQLIQSEKMASLGQLTAVIAHEIQNPLNFVNNFSEVSIELMEELKDERLKVEGERDEVVEEEIIKDITQNLEKITLHGKRADAIVKGMLEHSRASSGEKVPTDINALADEYLRLSYHGLRSKDKSFNADFKLGLDPNLPKINVVPQEIGRVLLNIINNAFQAVSNSDFSPDSYRDQNFEIKPLVTLSTKNLGDKIEIKISDNGPGIPDSIKDKIFQPFFTTKPTGQGTGLGLSLSYDIVKAHGGEIRVITNQREGSEFIIAFPTKN